MEVVQQECPTLVDDATAARNKFTAAFTLFGKCHNGFGKAKRMDAAKIAELGK